MIIFGCDVNNTAFCVHATHIFENNENLVVIKNKKHDDYIGCGGNTTLFFGLPIRRD